MNFFGEVCHVGLARIDWILVMIWITLR